MTSDASIAAPLGGAARASEDPAVVAGRELTMVVGLTMINRSVLSRLGVAALLAGIVSGCGGGVGKNQPGHLAAVSFGDLSHPLEQHAPAMAPLTEACALAPALPATGLKRRPYLQRLTDRSVDVVWTMDGDRPDAEIAVTPASGGETMRVPGVRDGSARPPGGAVQWMASIEDLMPGSTYCYELQAAGVTMAREGFMTAPPAEAGATVRFVAFGDSGTGGSDQKAVLSQMETVPLDFIVHTGDIAYESGTREELERTFFSVYADLLALFPVFPASGNHEYVTESAAPFREAFALPENGGAEGRERWYSYDFGDVHLVALDSERITPGQVAWLDADLTANRRRWTVVYLHRPPLSSGEHGNDPGVRRYFVPLFVRHHVPLVLSGHDHDYERTTPQDGVTYVVTGGGGVGNRSVGHSSFTAFAEPVLHFVHVTVQGDQLVLRAFDGVGQEFDSLELHR